MITVKPNGGLGNRIRVLYSVLGINRNLGHQVKIIWDCSSALNCPFEELFLCPEDCLVRNFKQGLFRKGYRFSLDKLRLSRLRKYKYNLVLTDSRIVKMRRENTDFFTLFKNHPSIYIETCLHFFDDSKITDFLEINPEVINEAQVIYNEFKPFTYGMHIRCTDNHISKKYSPPSAFKELVRNKLRKERKAHFFLATDSKSVEKEFIDEFKENITTTNNDVLDRNSKDGIKNALIDMICLSRTKKIYGSYYSSFSYVSAMLSGIEYENVVVRQPGSDD